jgi:small subunit ribosomal protein S17
MNRIIPTTTMRHLAYRFGKIAQLGERKNNFCVYSTPSIFIWSVTPYAISNNTIYPLQKQSSCIRYLSTQPMSSTGEIPSLSMIDDEPFTNNIPISEMSNEELADTSTIPGWDLLHSPPKKLPRGALIGTVISDKMNKTINVAVVRYRIVPKVRKRIRYTRKFMAHDETEIANMGDVVMITPSHRISKNKHFMLREIVRPKGQL